MATVTLTQLIARARDRANQENSTFVTDSRLNDYINEAWQKLWEMLVAAYDSDYFEKQATITLVPGTEEYALPADFFKLTLLEWDAGNGTVQTLEPYMRAERAYQKNQSILINNFFSKPKYRLGKSNTTTDQVVRILPSSFAGTVTVWYIPVANLLAVGADTVDVLDGWERFIVIDAAIQMMVKEESSTKDLMTERQIMVEQLVEMRDGRDQGVPLQTTDMDKVNSDYWY